VKNIVIKPSYITKQCKDDTVDTQIPLKAERKSRGGRMLFDTLIYGITKYHKQRKRFIVSKATKKTK